MRLFQISYLQDYGFSVSRDILVIVIHNLTILRRTGPRRPQHNFLSPEKNNIGSFSEWKSKKRVAFGNLKLIRISF